MKYLFIILACIILGSVACRKNNDCTIVTITRTSAPCSIWAINLHNSTYAADSIPPAFQQVGLTVCITYELYDDMRVCPCCGGTWARIKSIKLPD